MKKAIFVTLILISLAAILVRFLKEPVETYLSLNQVAGLKILSAPEADVFIDSVKVGKTPYEDEKLKPTEYSVKLESKSGNWQGNVNLKAGTITVINREIGADSASSSGEVLTLEKGSGVTVISNPSDANVEVDGKSLGKTPGKFNVDPGDHLFVVSHENHLNRSIKASVPEGYNLNMVVDLSLTEVDMTNFNPEPLSETPKVIVGNTPTGFLRVRDKPSLNGVEIARVRPGEELSFLEESDSWTKIRLSDGKEGYVSSQYVTKK